MRHVAETGGRGTGPTAARRGYWEQHKSYKPADAASARAFADPKAERIAEWAGLAPGEPILDVGAGTGHMTEALRRRGHPVVAVDASAAMLRRNPSPARVRADAARLPFRDGTFATAVEANLLHHVADPVAVLREMARVARGRVAAVEPNRNHPPMFLFSLLVREEWAGLRFTKAHVQGLAAAAGLRTVRIEATGWVYQNKTPGFLAGILGRANRGCPVAAYLLGVFADSRAGATEDGA